MDEDIAEAGALKKLAQRIRSAKRKTSTLIESTSGWVECNGSVPENAYELRALSVVPDVRGHCPRLTDAGRHRCHSVGWSGKEVEYEAGHDGIETVSDSRQIGELRRDELGALIRRVLSGESDISR